MERNISRLCGLASHREKHSVAYRVLKLKLLQLHVGDMGELFFDARRLKQELTVEDVLRQLAKLWGPQDNIWHG